MIVRDIKTNRLYDVRYNSNIDKYEQYDGNVLINIYGGCLLRCLLYGIYDKKYEVVKGCEEIDINEVEVDINEIKRCY